MKFPIGTVAGQYKMAVAQQPEYDAVRFDSQKINWSLQEFDVGSLLSLSLQKLMLLFIEILICFRLRSYGGWLHQG
jgi:hypothetical protein